MVSITSLIARPSAGPKEVVQLDRFSQLACESLHNLTSANRTKARPRRAHRRHGLPVLSCGWRRAASELSITSLVRLSLTEQVKIRLTLLGQEIQIVFNLARIVHPSEYV